MATYSPTEVFQTMQATGLVPLFFHPDVAVCKKVVKACYEGGARVFEFTNRGENALEIFHVLNEYVSAELPRMILGAGTVINAESASTYIESGANFIVSPVMKPEMSNTCSKHGIMWIPGCGTLTEMVNANDYGAELVKMFPAQQVGGPGFVKAVNGPCPWLNIMPTGGVSPEEQNLKAWFEAGVTCVGMGSKLILKEFIEEERMDDLKGKVAETIEIIERVKNTQ